MVPRGKAGDGHPLAGRRSRRTAVITLIGGSRRNVLFERKKSIVIGVAHRAPNEEIVRWKSLIAERSAISE